MLANLGAKIEMVYILCQFVGNSIIFGLKIQNETFLKIQNETFLEFSNNVSCGITFCNYSSTQLQLYLLAMNALFLGVATAKKWNPFWYVIPYIIFYSC